tara:strand:- start:753 stop:1067 length:315 start_codon:yes stop_codon:yes gene_type:complete
MRLMESQGAGREYTIHIGITVAAKGGKRIRSVYAGETRASSDSYTNAREQVCEADLRPEPLTIMPSTFHPDKESAFMVTVATTEPLQGGPDAALERLDESVPAS